MRTYGTYGLLLLLFINIKVEAQNFVPGISQLYWNYRYHLIGDDIDPTHWEAGLLQLGDCDGCSLPATVAVFPPLLVFSPTKN